MGKRITRKLSEETKKKISESMKGRKRTNIERQKISEGMRKYWETIPVE